MRVTDPVASLMLLAACQTMVAAASRLSPRNREFNALTGAAEAPVFNHSAQVLYGQSIGMGLAGSPPGALLCPDGVCEDGSCCGTNGKCGFEAENCGAGNCTSNCDAKAMCGRRSKDGKRPCGMNLCCSYSGWCGHESVHCQHADGFGPEAGKGDCQKGMGYCGDPAPMMPKVHGGSSSSGRKIGYWQSSNIHKRQFRNGKFKCPPVRPGDIPLESSNIPLGGGWTHLYYAFGAINPRTFHVVDDPTKQGLYKEFTDLKYRPNGPQTWFAIGGFDFSDPGVDPDAETDTDGGLSTHSTWSDMASTAGNRKAFIDSLVAFMDNHGFQGVDLDWEYPVSEDRGGRDEDMANFVSLVKEMRQTFGAKYGISVALAPDIWYLRYFDAISMQPYVDWFGFMAYDLHGVWASDSKQRKVRGQTDADEIYNDIIPLSFEGLDFSKINFGMALYGRGFKLADPNCHSMDGSCAWTEGSEPGDCTSFSGVLSYDEIMIKVADAKRRGKPGPVLDNKTMMKYFTWGERQENWIGYDDADTWQMKKTNLADKYGFGGTMFWSVDFLGQGANTSDVYLDPGLVCRDGSPSTRTASCHAPCRLVMPQCAIPATTITATYTISVEVYDGPDNTDTSTFTTAVTVTTDAVSFDPVYVGGGRQGGDVFTPVPAFPMPSVVVSVTHENGQVTPRTIALPNWPTTGNWPQPSPSGGHDPWQAPSPSSSSLSSSTTVPIAWTPDVPNPPPPPSGGPPPQVPSPTRTVTRPSSSATSTTTTAAVIAVWPTKGVQFTDKDDEDDELPCNAWFLNICITIGRFKIRGIRLKNPLPAGRYIWPPPPGAIDPPPGISISINPEPHVTLTRGNDNKWTTPRQEQDRTSSSCQHSTTVYDTIVSVTQVVRADPQHRTTRTETSTVVSTQVPRSGCADHEAPASTSTTATTKTLTCPADTLQTETVDVQFVSNAVIRGKEAEADVDVDVESADLSANISTFSGELFTREDNPVDCVFSTPVIIIPRDPSDTFDIEMLLLMFQFQAPGDDRMRSLIYTTISAPSHFFTVAYYLDFTTRGLRSKFDTELSGKIWGPYPAVSDKIGQPAPGASSSKRAATNMTAAMTRRAPAVKETTKSWSLSQISVPRRVTFNSRAYMESNDQFYYYYHKNAGDGQHVYVVEADGIPWTQHTEYDDNKPNVLPMQVYGGRDSPDMPADVHATAVVSQVIGRTVGIARRVKLWVGTNAWSGQNKASNSPTKFIRLLEALAGVLEKVARQGNGASSVLSLSFDYKYPVQHTELIDALQGMLGAILFELHSLGVVIVIASGNRGQGVSPADYAPQIYAFPRLIQNLPMAGKKRDAAVLADFANAIMLVGATGLKNTLADLSQKDDEVRNVHAPGVSVRGPRMDNTDSYGFFTGTSIATPLVAGLVAYLRSLPHPVLQIRLSEPHRVKYLIQKISRKIQFSGISQDGLVVPIIWNGQILTKDIDRSCFDTDDLLAMSEAELMLCPDIMAEQFWKDWDFWRTPNGPASGNGGGGGGYGSGITWQPGDPGPVCSSGRLAGSLGPRMTGWTPIGPLLGPGTCGLACNTDWYCDEWPDGMPPFYGDPLDPNNPYKDTHNDTYGGSGTISPGGTGPPANNNPPPSSPSSPPSASPPASTPPPPPSSTTEPAPPASKTHAGPPPHPSQPGRPPPPPPVEEFTCFYAYYFVEGNGVAAYFATATASGGWQMGCNGNGKSEHCCNGFYMDLGDQIGDVVHWTLTAPNTQPVKLSNELKLGACLSAPGRQGACFFTAKNNTCPDKSFDNFRIRELGPMEDSCGTYGIRD